MSDPVTNVEIEDVLSSIRRLVADGGQGSGTENSGPAEESDPDGPLVLTPSLRIGHEDDPADNDSLAVARRVARLEAALTVQEDEFEPDGSESEPVIDWSAHDMDVPMFHSRERAVREQDTLPHPQAIGDSADANDVATDIDMAGDDPSFDEIFGTAGMPSEDLLRDLVAEVLRDELAGALGERITRNVRKLVRREIHRILDSREVE